MNTQSNLHTNKESTGYRQTELRILARNPLPCTERTESMQTEPGTMENNKNRWVVTTRNGEATVVILEI